MGRLRQSTINFDGAKPPVNVDDSNSPEPAPSPPARRKGSEPVRQSFNHGRVEEGYVSGGEDVSDHEGEIRLERKKQRSSDDGQSQDEDAEDQTDEDNSQRDGASEESGDDSEEMMDLEAEDDESYESGDSLDEDEGGNRRRRRKSSHKKSKGKAREVETESESEVEATPKGRKRIVHDSDDEVIVEEPVASSSVEFT